MPSNKEYFTPYADEIGCHRKVGLLLYVAYKGQDYVLIAEKKSVKRRPRQNLPCTTLSKLWVEANGDRYNNDEIYLEAALDDAKERFDELEFMRKCINEGRASTAKFPPKHEKPNVICQVFCVQIENINPEEIIRKFNVYADQHRKAKSRYQALCFAPVARIIEPEAKSDSNKYYFNGKSIAQLAITYVLYSHRELERERIALENEIERARELECSMPPAIATAVKQAQVEAEAAVKAAEAAIKAAETKAQKAELQAAQAIDSLAKSAAASKTTLLFSITLSFASGMLVKMAADLVAAKPKLAAPG